MNPADPPTRRPDFLPEGGDDDSRHTLLIETTKGLVIQGSSLDEVDPRVDIWEVVPFGTQVLSDDGEESSSDVKRDFDLSFCPPSTMLRTWLLQAYEADPPDPEDDDLTNRDGLWWLRDRIFVPVSLRPKILKHYHDDVLSGHPGSLKTLALISRTMIWPGIRKDILLYTKSCFSCQRAKHSNLRPPGLMTSLAVPSRPWSVIGIDFVVKLPDSSGFDSILVIVDHFSKGVHLIPANETWTAEEFSFAFFDRFIRLHGLPDKIVSDRRALFVSKFWKEIQRLLRVKPAPSTAWHPRTDGQTERTNQTVETFLRHFVSDRQDDWFHLLPIAELVFNNSVSASTGFSPFFAQYAFHPRINMLSEGSTVPAAEQFLSNITQVQTTLQDNVKSAKEVQRLYFDKRTREAPAYKEGDWVWLLRRNIVSTRPSGKLDFKRLGPFRIAQVLGTDVYRLTLPVDLSKLHPVFHTSLLLPFVDPQQFPNRIGSRAPRGPSSLNPPFWNEHDVESILGYRSLRRRVHEYLVRWRGGSTADDSWEKGGLFAETLHPYLEQFHEQFGTDNIVLPPDKALRVLC